MMPSLGRGVMRMRVLVGLAVLAFAAPAAGQGFWEHWGDGRAELNGYRLTQPRYGVIRSGRAVYVYVTEDFSDRARVKAEGEHHGEDAVYPVLKLNAIRDFQTGIYDYNVMTSAFLRVERGWPAVKISFSAQDWCGQVYHQLLPRNGRVEGVFHSYFEGEADGREDLALPAGGVFEDALPIVLRGWMGEYLERGGSRTVPFLPALLHARLRHRPLVWTQARIARARETRKTTVPTGTFEVTVWTVEVEDGRRLVFEVEVASPYRLVRQAGPEGEELALTGSKRLAYWRLNGPGGERHLKELGLSAP